MSSLSPIALLFKLRQERVILTLLSLIFFLCCTSHQQYIRDTLPIEKEKILLSMDVNSKYGLYEYSPAGLVKMIAVPAVNFPSHIEKLYNHNDVCAALTEKDGIFLFFKNNDRHLHIPINQQGLADYRIRGIYMNSGKGFLCLYITYYAPAGLGVTECEVTDDLQFTCKTYNTSNSQLKSNFVHQVISDIKGNIWFRYASRDSLGVSMMNTEGEWKHFDRTNSNLGDNSVILISSEEENTGLEGDNVWFVTKGGLSKLQYNEDEEEWFFFGDKQTITNKLIRAIGIQHWFTDAIIDIVDLAVLPDSLMIANKYALFHFTQDNIERFLPEETGGTDELRIDRIYNVNDNIYVIIRPYREPRPAVKYLMMFQLEARKWQRINYWPLERSYAEDVVIAPFSEDKDIILFKYPSNKSRTAFFSNQDHSLTEIKIN